MGPGRPRKYFTPEQKRAANRAKSDRFYYKNRKAINADRRIVYHNNIESWDPSMSEKDREVRLLMRRLREHHADFEALVSPGPVRFMEKTHASLVEYCRRSVTGSDAFIDRRTMPFEEMRKCICPLGDQILTLRGADSKEYEEFSTITRSIGHLIDCLQDLWMRSTDGLHHLLYARENQLLLYQQLPSGH